MSKGKVLIVDEPTRGIDVGTKAEVHRLLDALVSQGVAVLMISSELPEILGMSDRIAVMRGGTIVKILKRSEATQEKIMRVIVRRGERLVDRDLERKLEEKLLGEAHP